MGLENEFQLRYNTQGEVGCVTQDFSFDATGNWHLAT